MGGSTFTRVPDEKVMLSEKSAWHLTPTTTTPPLAGFSSLEIAFDAVEGERIYGLGQHAAFPCDPSFPTKGQLSPKVVPRYAPTLL